MADFIKINDWKCKPGSNKEMLYESDSFEWLVGSNHEVIKGNIYQVEITEETLADGYRHIIKFI
jgi:hypothetical protein